LSAWKIAARDVSVRDRIPSRRKRCSPAPRAPLIADETSARIVAMKISTRVGPHHGIFGDHARRKTARQPLFGVSARHANAIRTFTQPNQSGADSAESKLESAFASTSGHGL
jgi:hypothetical protein